MTQWTVSPLDRRLFLLPGLAIALFVALVFADLHFVMTKSDQARNEREALEWELQQLEEERNTVQADLDFLVDHGQRYDRLVRQGWGTAPDRLAAARLLERLADQHRISALDYSFLPEQRQLLEDASGFERTRTVTAIEMRIDAVLDTDLTPFISELKTQLPGVLRIDQLEIERTRGLATGDITALRNGETITLVEASVLASWQNVQPGDRSP